MTCEDCSGIGAVPAGAGAVHQDNGYEPCPTCSPCSYCAVGGAQMHDFDPIACRCSAKGQPMTELGVVHAVDCAWLAWFRSSGGCMGDPTPEDHYCGRCPACGEFCDRCQGHGELADAAGALILRWHDQGTHSACHALSDCS